MKATWDDANGDAISGNALTGEGIHHQQLSLAPDLYQIELDTLKQRHGYISQDEISLDPTTPNLEEICAKFLDEHQHDDDEVRFILGGIAIFEIRSRNDRWMHLLVEAGDLIIVPAKRYHRFFLTEIKKIQAVRLFKDASGWEPTYRTLAT